MLLPCLLSYASGGKVFWVSFNIVAELLTVLLLLQFESFYEPLNVKLVIGRVHRTASVLSKFGTTIYELIILPFASSCLVLSFFSPQHQHHQHQHSSQTLQPCCRPVSGQSFYTTFSYISLDYFCKSSVQTASSVCSVARIFIFEEKEDGNNKVQLLFQWEGAVWGHNLWQYWGTPLQRVITRWTAATAAAAAMASSWSPLCAVTLCSCWTLLTKPSDWLTECRLLNDFAHLPTLTYLWSDRMEQLLQLWWWPWQALLQIHWIWATFTVLWPQLLLQLLSWQLLLSVRMLKNWKDEKMKPEKKVNC